MTFPHPLPLARALRPGPAARLIALTSSLVLISLLSACAVKSGGSQSGADRSAAARSGTSSSSQSGAGGADSAGADGAAGGSRAADGSPGVGGSPGAGGSARTGSARGAGGGGASSSADGGGAVDADGNPLFLYGDGSASEDDDFADGAVGPDGVTRGRGSRRGARAGAQGSNSASPDGGAGGATGQGAAGAAGRRDARSSGGAVDANGDPLFLYGDGSASEDDDFADGAVGPDGVARGRGSRRGARAGAQGSNPASPDRNAGGAGQGAAGASGAAGGRGSAAGRGGAGGGGAGGVEDEELLAGMVGAPGSRVRIEEEVTPQTLGGMLPLSIGVDEEGQFDFDQAVLRAEVKTILDELAGRLRDAEWDRLDLIGYTDRIGTAEYNQQLSERRAWAVARYLLDQGVPLNKLRVQGRGEHGSQVSEQECANLEREALIGCLQKDRRVAIEASIRKTQANIH